MPDLKIDFKNLGTIRFMPLDTSSLFLPFGRPVADYLRGAVESQNGARAVLRPGAIDFAPAIRWTASTASGLRTTGFGELEREGWVDPAGPAAPAEPARPADPGVADFLPLAQPGALSREAGAARFASPVTPEEQSIVKPRMAALPLRPRMTFGPPPTAAKPVAVPASAPISKPAIPPAAPKPVAAPAPPAKPGPVPAPKPVSVVKSPGPTPAQPKPVTAIPPAPVAAAARAPEMQSAPPKTATPPAGSPATPKVSAPAARAPEPRAPETSPAPSVPAPPNKAATVRTVETRAPEPAAETPAAKAAAAPPAPSPAPATAIERHLSIADVGPESFFEKIPMAAKIGAALLVLLLGVYLVIGKSPDRSAGDAVAVGEQGWSNEPVSDVVGSRHGRVMQLYRPSVGMSDYRFQFSGQIESKALGWVFREVDTNNYYAMKIETLAPGKMAITHFAVVEGRESGYSQRPAALDSRPGAVYKVDLDVSGPRFTVYVGGEPMDFWTDNRLKAGAVGFMNERDERGAASAVRFSFPKGVK